MQHDSDSAMTLRDRLRAIVCRPQLIRIQRHIFDSTYPYYLGDSEDSKCDCVEDNNPKANEKASKLDSKPP